MYKLIYRFCANKDRIRSIEKILQVMMEDAKPRILNDVIIENILNMDIK